MFKKLLQNIVYVLKKLKGKSFKRQLEFSSNLDQSDYFDFFL